MNLLGASHVAFAAAALISGLVVAVSRKGTRAHRRVGWVYVASMVALNVTALAIYRLTGRFGPFHIAAIFSLITVLAAVLPVRVRWQRWLIAHAYWMAGSYVGLLAAAAAEVTTRVPELPFWATALWTSVAVVAAGAVVIGRRIPPLLLRFPRFSS